MKKMVECILLNGYVKAERLNNIFHESAKAFYEKEDDGMIRHTLHKMELYYPICYGIISEILFNGKNTSQMSGQTEKYTNENIYSQNMYSQDMYPPDNQANSRRYYEENVYVENSSTSNNMKTNSDGKAIGAIVVIVLLAILCVAWPPLIFIIWIIFKRIAIASDPELAAKERARYKKAFIICISVIAGIIVTFINFIIWIETMSVIFS